MRAHLASASRWLIPRHLWYSSAMNTNRGREFRNILYLLPFLFFGACGHASTASRVRRLGEQEAQLRESVDTLEARQQDLRAQIERAQVDAGRARCEAGRESYRAVVAAVFAEYSVKVAQQRGCEAQAAKGGGMLAALGCGAAAFMTGGLALGVCGGALVAGAMLSDGCDSAPPPMTPEDIRQIAQAKTGMPREPTCEGGGPNMFVGVASERSYSAHTQANHPYRDNPDTSPGPIYRPHVGLTSGPTAAKPTGKNRRALRKAEKQRRKQLRRDRRRDKKVDAALDW